MSAYGSELEAFGLQERAELELASAAVSPADGCAHCVSVHARRFEQLTKRNDAFVQPFSKPHGAGTNARERALVQAAIGLTLAPASCGAAQLQGVRAAGLTSLEVLDLQHCFAIFASAKPPE